MTTIDQRILIPAAQTVVWNYISDVTNNPAWQAECHSVAFLTSKRDGPGTRWRYGTDKGREYVVEITAWYNGLGYEYVFVDGPPYRNNRGRIRLQEIPEGTIVQWTFSYEMGGMLANVRGNRRHLENVMANSLKTLYRNIKQVATDGNIETKSLMRDAPNVEARSQYRPRHPVLMKSGESQQATPPTETPVPFAEPPILEGDGQAIAGLAFEEPPVSIEDTRPRPAITGFERPAPQDEVPAVDESEPDFLEDVELSEPAVDVSDTQPRARVELPKAPMGQEPASEATSEERAVEPMAQADEVSVAPVEHDREKTAAEPDALAAFRPPAETEPAQETVPHAAISEPLEPPAPMPEPSAEASGSTTIVSEALRDSDTSGSSIWDIFGVPRPSTALEPTTVGQPVEEPVEAAPTAVSEPAPELVEMVPRTGLRIRLRRVLTHVRRPM